MLSLNWAYLGGFFDGEGCFVFASPNKTNRLDKVVNRNLFRPLVSVCQAEPQEKIIYEIAKFFDEYGLCYCIGVRKPGSKSQNPVHRIDVVKQHSVVILLENLVPHLFVKREKAEEMLVRTRERLELRSHRLWRSVLHDLPESQVREMFRLWREEGMSQAEIGKLFGMHQVKVSRCFQAWEPRLNGTLTIAV